MTSVAFYLLLSWISLINAVNCYAEYCYAESQYAEYHFAEYCYAEYHYAEYCYAECHYAVCRGTEPTRVEHLIVPRPRYSQHFITYHWANKLECS
jgi:hypothetical protein